MDEEQNDFFKEYGNKIMEYVEDQILLARLKTVKKISSLVGRLVIYFIVVLLCTLIFLFVSVIAGFLFGNLFHSNFAGFAAVAGLFIIALIFVIAKRKTIQQKFSSNIIDIILDKNDDKNEND
jgi:energy-coupling factor transporter transmembrane protein EcfT